MDGGRPGGSLTSRVWFMDSDWVKSPCFVLWLVGGFGKTLHAFFTIWERSERFCQSVCELSLRVRKLSDDAVPMPTQVSRTHRQASKVQEHPATAGLSKFHFHGFQRAGIPSAFHRRSRFRLHRDFFHADESGIGEWPYVSSQTRDNFSLQGFSPAPTYQSANRWLFQRGDGPKPHVTMKTVQWRTVATTNFILRAQAANLTRRGRR